MNGFLRRNVKRDKIHFSRSFVYYSFLDFFSERTPILVGIVA